MSVLEVPLRTRPDLAYGFSRDTVPLFVLPGMEGSVYRPQLGSPESDLVGFSESLYQAGLQFRDRNLGMLDRWRAHLAWYLGSSQAQMGYRTASDTIINMIFEKVEKLTADVTQNDPSVQYLPQERGDVPFSEMMNPAWEHIWGRQHGDVKFLRTIKAANIIGTWYWSIVHDPGYQGMGGPKIVPTPAWNIIPAPYHEDPDSAPWYIHVRFRSVGEVWNDYRVAVEPEIGSGQIDIQMHELVRQYPFLSMIQTATDGTGNPTPMIVPAVPDTFMGTYGRAGFVLQKELHIKDGSTSPKYWWDEANGTRPPTLMRSRTLRYPRGRVISWANGRLLYDMENPYRDGLFPLVKFTDISIPDFWYGMGEVEPLVNLQVLQDDVFAIFKQILAFTASGRLVVDESTGLEEGDIGNEPGEIWFTNEGTWDRLKWFPGEQFPPSMFQFLSMLQQGADLVSGSHDVTRGINPTGVTAGKALIALQQVAGIRVKSRMKEHTMPFVGAAQRVASRIQQFWPSAKTIRIVGRDRATNENLLDVQFRDFVITAQDREAAYDVRVIPGASTEDLRQAEFERAMMLYQLGNLSDEMLVDHSGLPDKERIKAEIPILRVMRATPPQASAGPSSGGGQRQQRRAA